MKKELFEELLASVKQGTAIMKEKIEPSRTTEFFAEAKSEVK